MHGSILILAKKKAAGPGGYFDPMAGMGDMPLAMGPAVFEMAEGQEDENTDPKGYDVATMDKAKGSPSMTLREIAAQLDQSSTKHAGQAKTLRQIAASLGNGEEMESEEEEGEETEEVEEMPKEAPKAKKGPPAFLKKKVMAY